MTKVTPSPCLQTSSAPLSQPITAYESDAELLHATLSSIASKRNGKELICLRASKGTSRPVETLKMS